MAGEAEIIIRDAKDDDCDGIYNLMKKLAEQRGLGDKFILKLEDVKQYGFNDGSYLHGVVAETTKADGVGTVTVLGCCLYFYDFLAFRGRGVDFAAVVVSPQYQGRGVGQLLKQAAIRNALTADCKAMNFQVEDTATPEEFLQFVRTEEVGSVNDSSNMARLVSGAEWQRLVGNVEFVPFKAKL